MLTIDIYVHIFDVLGIFVTEKDDRSFDSKVSVLTDVLEKQQTAYEEEETALNVLGEEGEEERQRAEGERRKKSKESRE